MSASTQLVNAGTWAISDIASELEPEAMTRAAARLRQRAEHEPDPIQSEFFEGIASMLDGLRTDVEARG